MQATLFCKFSLATSSGTPTAQSSAFSTTLPRSSTTPSRSTTARSLKNCRVQKGPFKTAWPSTKSALTDHSSNTNQFRPATHNANRIWPSWGARLILTPKARNCLCNRSSTRAANLSKFSCQNQNNYSMCPPKISKTVWAHCCRLTLSIRK